MIAVFGGAVEARAVYQMRALRRCIIAASRVCALLSQNKSAGNSRSISQNGILAIASLRVTRRARRLAAMNASGQLRRMAAVCATTSSSTRENEWRPYRDKFQINNGIALSRRHLQHRMASNNQPVNLRRARGGGRVARARIGPSLITATRENMASKRGKLRG